MPPEPVPSPRVPLPRQIANYFWRATFLKCPVCGTRPLFLPLAKVRKLDDWFTPLDGCPVCGYAYDREPGYFLMAQWGLGYGVAAVAGILIYAYLQVFHADWSLLTTLLLTAAPVPVVGFFFARHAKAYFLAIDHLFDPHIPGEDEDDLGGGDGGGGQRPRPAPAPVDGDPAHADPAGQPGSGVEREREAGAERELAGAGTPDRR